MCPWVLLAQMQVLGLMSKILPAPDLLGPSPPRAPAPSQAFAPAGPLFLVQLTLVLREGDTLPLSPRTEGGRICTPLNCEPLEEGSCFCFTLASLSLQ